MTQLTTHTKSNQAMNEAQRKQDLRNAQVEIQQIARQMMTLAYNIEGQPLKSALDAIIHRIANESPF